MTVPVYNMTDTWNNGATAFTAIQMNVTNTASAAGSFLIDLQISGTSQFHVDPSGNVVLISGGTYRTSGNGFFYGSGSVPVYWNGGADFGAAGLDTSGGVGGWFLGLSSATNGQSVSATQILTWHDSTTNGIVDVSCKTNASALRVYNTVDNPYSPTNYERGVIDWTTTANTLTVGTQAGGTGTGRILNIVSAASAGEMDFTCVATNSVAFFTTGFRILNTGALTWSSNGDASLAGGGSTDTRVSRTVAGVVSFDGASTNDHAGWVQWAGEARVTSDVTFTSTTTLATVTGLSVSVAAGRTYSFQADLSFTDAAAGGIQAAIAGTCTATNIIYDGWIVDSAANGIKGNAQATALATAVASATTTGTAGHVTIKGTITVNAAGTLLVQAAQNTSNGTATTVKRGSTFFVYDMP